MPERRPPQSPYLFRATRAQFLRYRFDATVSLQAGTNSLSVAFNVSTDPRNNESRWMPCSGGWE